MTTLTNQNAMRIAVPLLVVTACAGCHSSKPARPAAGKLFAGVTLSVAAIGEPRLIDLVDAQRGEWEESRGARIALRKDPFDPAKASDADVILFRGDQLGALVDAGALAVLRDSLVLPPAVSPDDEKPASRAAPDPLALSEVVAPVRELVIKYGADRMALPLGGSALVVVYRREAFENDAVRKAAELAGVALEPPATWEAFDALAKFLHARDWDGSGQKKAAVALAFGDDDDGVANATFLARATALGLHKDQFGLLFDSDEGTPRINTPPFVEALGALVALKQFAAPNAERFDAKAARAAFRAGDAALLIDRAEHAGFWIDPKKPLRIGVVAMPGSSRVYNPERKAWEKASPPNRPSYLPLGGGWLVGLSSAATGKQRDAGLDLLKYLAVPETALRLAADSTCPMLPVRASQVAGGPPDSRAAAGLDPRSWSDAVSKTWQATQISLGPRLPGIEGYLNDLSIARAQAMKGESPESALAAAAEAWKERTAALGADRQLWHYRRSLNRLSTSKEPPPRS
jgi:multiple sugar transport system substrate-binding protein